MEWVWAIIIVTSIAHLLQRFLRAKKNSRKLPPGPKGLPILGHIHMLGKNPNQDLYHLAKRFGPIMYMRLGFVPTIVVSSPQAAEQFLKTYDHVFASRPPHECSRYISYDQKNLTFAPYGPYWRNMRKLCTLELLGNSKITSFEPMRKAEVDLLTQSLKEAAANRGTVDLSAKLSSLSANMSCLMVFGKKYMDQEIDKRGFRPLIREALRIAATPNVSDFFPFLRALDLQGLARRVKVLSKTFDAFFESVIDEHVQSKDQKQTKDFVDTMMSVMESADFEFDRRHVKSIMLDMLVASMDTSAAAIEWTIAELFKHPPALKKLREEIQEAVGLERMVEESDLESLKYLEMVVKESLRLHPVVPLLLPHESMEDCTVDGYEIPNKSRIIVNLWAVGRDPDAWKDPEKFDPDRFMGSNIDLRGRDFQLIPFGSGRRGCPGMQLGLTVIRLGVAQLVHCFDWELPNEMEPSDLDMSEEFGLVIAKAKPLVALPTYRLHN